MKLKKIQDVKYIIIHAAATKPSMDIGIKEITRWHRERGFFTVGYHYVIRRDGTLETGRPVGTMGAHAYGHNHHSVGVCMVGGVSEEDVSIAENNYTEEQWACLKSLVEHLKDVYPDAEVIGHRDVSDKECPSFDAKAWYATEFS